MKIDDNNYKTMYEVNLLQQETFLNVSRHDTLLKRGDGAFRK